MSLLFRVILIGKSVILIDPTASVMNRAGERLIEILACFGANKTAFSDSLSKGLRHNLRVINTFFVPYGNPTPPPPRFYGNRTFPN
jgi:hypothetical protein